MTKHCHWLQAQTVWKMVSQDLKPIGSKYIGLFRKGLLQQETMMPIWLPKSVCQRSGFAQVWIPAKSHSIELVETQGRYSFSILRNPENCHYSSML